MATRIKNVNGSTVRTWLLSDEGQAALDEAGLDQPGQRGRLSAGQVGLFETANKGFKYSTGHVEPRKISGMRLLASGKKVPISKSIQVSEVRAFAQAQGLITSTRGRLPQSAYDAFLAAV